jgi:hypothetical protein
MPKNISGYKEAWCQEWEESERGWGVRPDGCSLHLTEEDAKAYVKGFRARERERNPSGEVPDEYERTSGHPHKVLVPPALHKKIQDESKKADTRKGLRFWSSQIEFNQYTVATEREKSKPIKVK